MTVIDLPVRPRSNGSKQILPTPASITELPRENELLERQMTALAEMNAGDWRAQDAGLKLADFECKHGALPGDQGITCSCWDGEPVTLSIAA